MKPSAAPPILNEIYARYLHDEDSAAFIRSISQRYMVGTLERLTELGHTQTRRAAALALTFLGNYESNAALGRALHDEDRCVRVIAENGIRDLWMRDGDETQQQKLKIVMRLNSNEQFTEAGSAAEALIDEAPWFAEAWNQRAIARFHLDQYEESAADCRQTLEINPYHFGAAVGMAHCYLELNDGFAALECFRRAIKLNPDMEEIQAQVEYLERMLEGNP